MGYDFAVSDRVEYLNRLISGVGRADVPGNWNAARKLKGAFLFRSGQSGPYEVLNEARDLYPDSS